MKCNEVYENGLFYHHYANTAYPLTSNSFMEYKIRDDKQIKEIVRADWENAEELSLYIHIPFCKTRCKFCEYVVLENPEESLEDEYVKLLLKEINMYSEILKGKKIIGYDLGGGTPAKLSVENLKKITRATCEKFNIDKETVFSVETTPVIAAEEPDKIKALYDIGYKRISMGIQTVSEKLLSELGREGSASLYEKAVENIRKAGYERFNIDLMYGFLHQNDKEFENTLRYAVLLSPEYITLYRNRYKGTKLEFESGGVSIYKALHQYQIAYNILRENGYHANVGKNTFSRIENDYGTSDYLTNRVVYGIPYVGIGLGAQSFAMNYLAYNLGAADKRLERYKKAILENKLPFQDIYKLPIEESIAKMVSVSFYFGFVDLDAFEKRFGIDFCKKFEEEVKYTLDNNLLEIKERRIYLTEKGSDFINGVIPLFYSNRSKEELKHIFTKKQISYKTDEEIFLEAYNINDYNRPSVAVDIAVFALCCQETDNYKQTNLSLLLIKRGEHPYMNKWALPGGFVKPNETIEECAFREVKEETSVEPLTIIPVGVFSKPDRDPRGRIISNTFASVITGDIVEAERGGDSIDARWFDIMFYKEEDLIKLTLIAGDIKICAILREKISKFKRIEFDVLEGGGLAFDHAEIIATAISTLRYNGLKLN
ncbi:UNVERIFIED_CONTAM: oxygen-independent coproporphyrinogen-3 oxidase [Acetivibrio alkalicellulosi]